MCTHLQELSQKSLRLQRLECMAAVTTGWWLELGKSVTVPCEEEHLGHRPQLIDHQQQQQLFLGNCDIFASDGEGLHVDETSSVDYLQCEWRRQRKPRL